MEAAIAKEHCQLPIAVDGLCEGPGSSARMDDLGTYRVGLTNRSGLIKRGSRGCILLDKPLADPAGHIIRDDLIVQDTRRIISPHGNCQCIVRNTAHDLCTIR